MSKILVYADNHFSEKSSILTKFGAQFWTRLENQIESINWIEQYAAHHNIDAILCLGDFFDHNYLKDTEISALTHINWSSLPHYYVVGNHESGFNGLTYNVADIFKLLNYNVINSPSKISLDETIDLCALPYIVDSDQRPLEEYFGKKDKPRIIFSHNDLADIQMGPVISKVGFKPTEIETSCDLFINGHLHNGKKISDKIINLGNLTGKDFGEDACIYTHNVMILDTSTLQYELVENPHAFNFYRITLNSLEDFSKLDNLKSNAVVMFSLKSSLEREFVSRIDSFKNIVAYKRITMFDADSSVETDNIEDLYVDSTKEFYAICKAKIENSQILDEELAEIFK